MKHKKSQIQIGETISVLAVFFIIALIGVVIYFNIARSNLEDAQRESLDTQSIGIVQRVLSFPEIQCSENNVLKENCVDLLKLQAISGMDPGGIQELYFDSFGFSKVEVDILYPDVASLDPALDPPSPYVIYDNEKPDFRSLIPTRLPVSVFDPLRNQYYFGVLRVSTYS